MGESHKIFGILFGLGVLLAPMTVKATQPTENYTTYSTQSRLNSTLAASIETALSSYLDSNELNALAFSLYAQGSNNPPYDRVQTHITTYCSANVPTEASAFGCKISGSSGTISPQELGDIKASGLLDETTYSTTTSAAAQTFLKNLLMPAASTRYADMISNTASFGNNGNQQNLYAKFLSNNALLGLAVYSMEYIFGMRTPGSTLGVGGSASSSSMLAVMENEAIQRFTNPAYADFVVNSTTTALQLQQEQVLMQSFQLWLDYQSYRQNERIESLLAGLLAKEANNAIIQDSYSATTPAAAG